MPEDALNGHRPGLKPRLNGCLSRMQGNLHVRFLGGDMTVRSYPYPSAYEGSIPFTRSSNLPTPAVALTLSAKLHTPIPSSRLHQSRAVVVCVLFKGDRLAAQQGFHAACHRFAVALGKVAQNQQQKIRVILRQAGLQ